MRKLTSILFIVLLFGCVHSPDQKNVLTDANTSYHSQSKHPQPLIKEEINSFAMYDEQYKKYHIVNVNNPVFYISNTIVKTISQDVWQRAGKRDGEVIDACAYNFKSLKEKTLNIVTEIKKY